MSKKKGFLRQTKQLIDKTLLAIDRTQAEPQVLAFTANTHYGPKLKITSVDQLGKPNTKKVTGYYQTINDLAAAKRFGTDSIEKYSFWSWRACGVANVMAILRAYKLYSGTLFDLVRELEMSDGYLFSNRWGKKDIGWKHSSLASALNSRGLVAKVEAHLSLWGLLDRVAKGRLVIASIKARGNKGSHMVIIAGFTWNGDRTQLELRDPYFLDGHGGDRKMSLTDFGKIYLKRGISVWSV